MKKSWEKKNIAASVRRRLLDISREKGEDFNFILTRYGLERLMYRIGVSEYSEVMLTLKRPKYASRRI